MNKNEWYEKTTDIIMGDIEDFYSKFYKKDVIDIGQSGYRVNPCPMCNHNDCATVGEAVHCFSCGWKGTHISAWYEYATDIEGHSIREAISMLDDFTKLRFPQFKSGDIEEYEKERITQGILRIAEDYYHDQLIKSVQTFEVNGRTVTPLDYLLKIRLRKMTTIEDFKIGFSTGYLDLHKKLLQAGYTKEQIKKSRAWIPEGLIIYYYKDPLTRDITRINTKNPFGAVAKHRDENGNIVEKGVIPGYSVGEKTPMFTPKFSFKKPFIVVEGENDLGAIYENGGLNACCIGGNISIEQMRNAFSRSQSTIYAAFDNDKVGDKYLNELNAALPQKDVRKVSFPEIYNDPDDYYKSPESKHVDILTKEAVKLTTEEYVIHNDDNIWVIENRHKRLEFIIGNHSDKGQITGTINLYIDGALVDREVDKDLTKCKGNKKPFNFYLHDRINEHFNTGLKDKTVEELTDIYWYSSKKTEIIRRLAELLTSSNNDEGIINTLKLKLKTSDGREDIIDAVLKEANDIQNKLIGSSIGAIPKIKVSQYFNVGNNDGYFYFMNYKQDGDSLRRLPFLLRNDKALIRLDLLKKKDPQCLLLIDNKYELPVEISEAIMDPDECSLTQEYVYKYIDGKIPKEELEPDFLINVLTGYFRKFYYTTKDYVYKILSLYTMMTYYYEVFNQIPYLFINGKKGSGKSVLGAALHLFCFNAKMATDISDASLFRITSLEGGTLILDEMEQLTSRKKGSDSTMGTILKGGYKRASNVYRADTESASKTNKYDSYGPKIIINIFGLDDIIKDRCIPIDTYRYLPTKSNRREDPKSYLKDLDKIRAITSRLSLSALENFKEVHAIYSNDFFETNNARLSEILTPLLVIARFVDRKEREELSISVGSYEKAIHEYYFDDVKGDKEDTEENTPEGIITNCIPQIAMELYGLVPQSEKMYTIPENHKYTEPIKYNLEEGWFEVNAVHLKVFIEEHQPGEVAHAKLVVRWLKTCYDISHKDIKRTVINIDNDDLSKEFKGNTKPKVNTYRFYFRDFISKAGDDFLGKDISNKTESKKNKLF